MSTHGACTADSTSYNHGWSIFKQFQTNYVLIIYSLAPLLSLLISFWGHTSELFNIKWSSLLALQQVGALLLACLDNSNVDLTITAKRILGVFSIQRRTGVFHFYNKVCATLGRPIGTQQSFQTLLFMAGTKDNFLWMSLVARVHITLNVFDASALIR